MNMFVNKRHNYDDRIQQSESLLVVCRTHQRGLAFPQDSEYGLGGLEVERKQDVAKEHVA